MDDYLLANANQSQLLIIDIQEKLVNAIPDKIINSVLKNICAIQEMAQLLNIPILISEQYPKGLGSTNKKIIENLKSPPSIIEKTSFSCCQATDFSKEISKNREQIILVGMESHICVLQTAIQLATHHKKVFVIEDAVCSRNKYHHKNALTRLSKENIIISNTESLIFEWLEDTSNPHFKTASRLIR